MCLLDGIKFNNSMMSGSWLRAVVSRCSCQFSRAEAIAGTRHGRVWASTSTSLQPEYTLNTGARVPGIGLGTWLSKPGTVGVAVDAALREGYRHIDCAHRYANEDEIGATIHKCIQEGVVKRDELFVASKLWVAHHAYEDVLPACRQTLKDLQLDYLDLYLSHWPLSLISRGPENEQVLIYDPELEARCWQAMEELVSKGLVKAIGISNFTITKTERLLQTAKIVPAVNQIEYHPYLQQDKLKTYCNSKGILIECYSPLGNPQNPYLYGKEPALLEDPVIKDIAAKHGVSVAQVCISFSIHQDNIVLPKSVTPSRIMENLKACELRLDAEDMQRLSELRSRKARYVHGDFFPKRGWTDSNEYLWDETEDARFELKTT